jgi:ribosomal protein L7/L12
MNTPIPEETALQIREALFRGNKIEAIKIYRKISGTGLAEAKASVETLEQELRVLSPEKFTKSAAGKGCLAMILGSAVVTAIVWSVLS